MDMSPVEISSCSGDDEHQASRVNGNPLIVKVIE